MRSCSSSFASCAPHPPSAHPVGTVTSAVHQSPSVHFISTDLVGSQLPNDSPEPTTATLCPKCTRYGTCRFSFSDLCPGCEPAGKARGGRQEGGGTVAGGAVRIRTRPAPCHGGLLCGESQRGGRTALRHGRRRRRPHVNAAPASPWKQRTTWLDLCREPCGARPLRAEASSSAELDGEAEQDAAEQEEAAGCGRRKRGEEGGGAVG